MKEQRWTGMSDTRCEQHPLLYEDLSDEERLGPSIQRRLRPMVFRGRAKNKVKGAVAVIKLWPGHWSTSLTYWWIALGMIAIVTFIIYNSIAALALPTDHFRGIKARSRNNVTDTDPNQNSELQSVYMHLFFDNNKDVEFNSYLPYIKIIADKYPDYNYKLIIITNDTNVEASVISAEENNEIAFDLLWTNKDVHQTSKNNVIIEQITLTKYMENSPLGKYWETLPNEFIEFLARAVSIWDKGGITFNPIILTPRSPHAIYIEKLQDILRNYPHISKIIPKERKTLHHGPKKKVNNIRDIIDALERENGELSSTEQSLEAAESKNDIILTNGQQKSIYYLEKNIFNNTKSEHNHESEMTKDLSDNITMNYSPVTKTLSKTEEVIRNLESENGNEIIYSPNANDTKNFGLLPIFLDFLFLNKPLASEKFSYSLEEPKVVTRKRKHVLPSISKRNKNLSSTDKSLSEKQKPVIIPANYTTNIDQVSVNETEKFSQLTIDLKGYIIASVTPCHAFLGTIFSNLVHLNQESLTNFIKAELSIFCKGVLSSCYGIDVILL